ncbi:MAG TPA: Glu/Leu/Phe/Val dehydrogenase dimerization domain-containing protein [Conexibacter sp.]|nr:Glu/Leu/Phe/Val dehydrogenase dimerization domain-containing protein [Conexibacter sp.]
MAAEASFEHEQLTVRRGERSGVPVMVAIHSTRFGPSVGGCRMRAYERWQDGVEDALRLAEAMSLKSALAGVRRGGGKGVIALPPGVVLTDELRRAALHDFGDLVEALGGRYAAAPDVGTSSADMVAIRERTAHVFGLPAEHGGAGDSSGPTARGVHAALRALARRLYGTPSLAGRTVTIVGLGGVGAALARRLAEEGARLQVTDVVEQRRELADELAASWLEPADALAQPTELLAPCALGGVLSAAVVAALRCDAIAGAANNQLADPAVAELLAARGILWAPDFIASAGGIVDGIARDVEGAGEREAGARVDAIEQTLARVLDDAERDGVTPLAAALALARRSLDAGVPGVA